MPAAALLPEGGSKEEEEEGERSLWVAFHVPWPPRQVAEPCPGAPLLAACPGCAVAVLGLLEEEAAGGAGWGAPAVAAVLGTGCARAGLCSPGTPLKEGAREPPSPRLPPSLFSMAMGCPELDEV